MVRYLFYTIGDLTYQSPLVCFKGVIKQREYVLCEVRAEAEGTVDFPTYNKT